MNNNNNNNKKPKSASSSLQPTMVDKLGEQEQQQQQSKQLLPKQHILIEHVPLAEMKRETELLLKRRAPSADVARRRSLRRIDDAAEKRSLNHTFTAGMANGNANNGNANNGKRQPTPFFRRARPHRSNSIDSEFGDFGETDALFGILSARRNRSKSRERLARGGAGCEFSWRPPPAAGSNNNSKKLFCSSATASLMADKLPPLDAFRVAGRTSCQFQHLSRTQFELVKYKRNLQASYCSRSGGAAIMGAEH